MKSFEAVIGIGWSVATWITELRLASATSTKVLEYRHDQHVERRVVENRV
jgi:hypothetical protein